MFSNNHHHPPHHHQNDDTTVQITDATSLLGTHLIEGDWDELLDHLSTPEGHRDVIDGKDPLGLFHGAKIGHGVPSNEFTTSAFYAGIYVRAPINVIEKIYSLDKEKVDEHWTMGLMCVLAVIPSEEEERLKSNAGQRQVGNRAKKILQRMRTWTKDEFGSIVNLFIMGDFGVRRKDATKLLEHSPQWIIPAASTVSLTPLAIAAYNPDVTANTLRSIHMLEPRAIRAECTLFGMQTIPLHIAAASPLPPMPTPLSSAVLAKYKEGKNNRWEKVKLLVILGDNSLEGAGTSKEYDGITAEPTMHQIYRACEEAARRKEWELVREFLKQYYYNHHEDGEMPSKAVQAESTDNTNIIKKGKDEDEIPVVIAQPITQGFTLSPSSPSTTFQHSNKILEPFHAALLQHDEKLQTYSQQYDAAKEKQHAREDWMHKNMGLVMYPVDAALDLATAMMPSSWMRKMKRPRGGDGKVLEEVPKGIVGPMS